MAQHFTPPELPNYGDMISIAETVSGAQTNALEFMQLKSCHRNSEIMSP
jgi:hypothetical protein